VRPLRAGLTGPDRLTEIRYLDRSRRSDGVQPTRPAAVWSRRFSLQLRSHVPLAAPAGSHRSPALFAPMPSRFWLTAGLTPAPSSLWPNA